MLLIVALGAIACGADRGSYIRANARILETLPQVPGAVRLRQESSPYYLRERGPPDGYTTNVVYEVPLGTTDHEVVDFYVRNLRNEWEFCLEELPVIDLEGDREEGRVLNATFVRDGASVTVMTDGMLGGTPHTYEISIDHRTYRNSCAGEDLR